MSQERKKTARLASGGALRRRAARDPDNTRPEAALLSEQAYLAIKQRIVTLAYYPGRYLNEAAISRELSMGRTPVYQALQRLKVEGLVEIVPRKGVIVQPDTVGRILEILDARMMIEPELARRVACEATESDVAYLETVLHDANQVSDASAIDSYSASDRAFHITIATISGNQVMQDFVTTLHERSMRFWYQHLWQPLDPNDGEQEHKAVLDAIRSRDGHKAANAMQAHLDRLRVRLVEIRDKSPRPVNQLPRH